MEAAQHQGSTSQTHGSAIMKKDLAHAVKPGRIPDVFQDPTTETASLQTIVTTRDGKAILIGAVRSWQERLAAERATWASPEVREIDDRLVVVPKDES